MAEPVIRDSRRVSAPASPSDEIVAPCEMVVAFLAALARAALAVAAATGVSSFYLPDYIAPALPPLILLYAAGYGVAARVTRKIPPDRSRGELVTPPY